MRSEVKEEKVKGTVMKGLTEMQEKMEGEKGGSLTNEVREKGGTEMTSVAVKLTKHNGKTEQLLSMRISVGQKMRNLLESQARDMGDEEIREMEQPKIP